jgi:PAS domain S-box-containing protein
MALFRVAMPSAPLTLNESRRLAVLRELALLDSEPDPSFDALVQAAGQATGCPISLITLVDERRQWFKAAHGVDLRETPRELSFCAHAILGDTLLEVPDTHDDPRFADNPFVRGEPNIRFYAGVPLQFLGQALGTLCVMDHRVHRLDAAEREALSGLARVAADLLRGRRHALALQAEHERLLDFSRASGDWMWETDDALRLVWLSDEFEAVTGQPVAGALGQTVADLPLLDAEGAPHPQHHSLGALLHAHQPFSRAVTRTSTPHGLKIVSRSAVPVFDDAGRFRGYRGTARDITAQVEAAHRAHAHDALLRKLSSQVPGVIFQFLMTTDGKVSYPYASDGLREMFGMDASTGNDGGAVHVPLRLVHQDERQAFVESINESARLLRPWQREYRIVRTDGSTRWLETRAMPERLADGCTMWHGFTADISERKETELALRRSEERWEMAADAAGIGIAEADFTTGLLSLDRRACLNHGLSFPQHGYTLSQWLATIDDTDREAAKAGLQHAADTHGTLETRYLVHRPDGSTATLEITARGRHDAQGQPAGLVGTCRDVTAQVAVQRLQRDKETAERANRAKSEFLSRVSHELRTPLNGILGFAQLMSLDRVDTLADSQQRRLDSVMRAGRHLLALINDVLDVARIESDDFSLQPDSVDAWAAIAECLSLIQPLADEAGVRLPVPPADAPPVHVRADPRALEQVLMNLMSNAIKYNRPAGAVHIDVSRSSGDTDGVCIAIRDEGRGMNEAQLAGLFQPFNRLGAEHTRTEGSGLGLVICRRLLDAMSGQLRVESHAGAGSVFTIGLPGASTGAVRASVRAPVHAVPPASETGPRAVLYIEDEPLNTVLMEEVFRARPTWTLLSAEDGTTGLHIARASRPDLMLIDMNLPDMNGLALIRRVRGDPRMRGLRCIALSADAMREQIDAALAAGFDDYWTKPIDVAGVLVDLDRLLALGQKPRP